MNATRQSCRPVGAAWSQALAQALMIGTLVAASALLAATGLAALARPLFVLGAIVIAGFAIHRSPWEYLTATLWFWTICPFVRRIIDMYGGFEVFNIVLVTPNVLSLFMLRDLLTSRDLLRRPESAVGMLLFLPALYGLGVSFVHGDIMPGAVAAADWFTPLLYYFYLINLAPRIDEADPFLRAFIPLNMLIVVGYGVYQYVNPPIWDVEWIVNSMMDSVGTAVPYGLRVFSTLNGPGLCAAWLSALTLLALHFRTRLSMLLLPPMILVLALTLVRANIGGTILGLSILVLFGRGVTIRTLLAAAFGLLTVVAIVSLLNVRVADTLTQRFETVNHLGNDQSALARGALYLEAPALIDAHPLGMGIGALGRGAVAAKETDLVNLDSGPIAIYLALGWIAGSVYFLGLLAVTIQALSAAKSSNSPAALVMAAVAVAIVAMIAFVNVVGLQGMILGLAAGYAAAVDIHTRSRIFRPAFPVSNHDDGYCGV
ncbi:MAG TPA: hypothetical protein VNE18_02055 [Rhodanobacter sp.]|nr:hypothetical protein [Rhodanobacter sp.]